MAHRPIIHGNFSNETPDKCMKCANRVFNDETQRWECCKTESHKFVPTIAFGCFTRKN